MDFFKIQEHSPKKGVLEIYPSFKVARSKDLMVRGKSFYAIWDEEKGLWSTDEFDVQRLVDKELYDYAEYLISRSGGGSVNVKQMGNYNSNSWRMFRSYLRDLSDNAHELDTQLSFSNTKISKKDYASKTLPYPLEKGAIDSWNILMDAIYDKEERQKIEWGIGAVVAGEAKNIQKFIVIYGAPGTGKSTILDIIQKLFQGYCVSFEAKALGTNTNQFATEPFKGNPLVAIDHDADLSRIEDNTRLNSIVSHEVMTRNEKNRPIYSARSNAFIFVATNKPVKITDAKSGLLRRLIDVRTSGRYLEDYDAIISRISFELGAIAYHCLEVFKTLGKDAYSNYRPVNMQFETDPFLNFVEDNYYTFVNQDGTTLNQAWDLYKAYCEDSKFEFRLPRHKFREELKNYFKAFQSMGRNVEGKQQRSVYSGFKTEKFSDRIIFPEKLGLKLVLDKTESLLDKEFSDSPAQYANSEGIPSVRWSNVSTKLSDIDTQKLHYVQLPSNHIVIDFDLKDDAGNKSLELNLEAASKMEPTYAEYSKSGKGIHLHYIYDGDINRLSSIYSEGIEIKTFVGNSSLRRQLTKCNDKPIVHINSGLPLKGEKVFDAKTISSEKALRELIIRNLRKEIHPGTKPSIDFIHKILEDAYNSGLRYDVSQLFPDVLAFANNSTNQSDYCVKLVSKMRFQSDHEEAEHVLFDGVKNPEDSLPIVFFDVEVFPNLLIVCWKYQGDNQNAVRLFNPSSKDIEKLLSMKLIGFNNRRYDNHILYARYLGYNNQEIFEVSSKIVSNDNQNGYFREAYEISYTDVYDFASAANKKSLKKWEIELGIHHQELGHPWDQPIPEELWIKAAEYCENDLNATEAVFNHLSGDWAARKVVSELSGLTVNHTTNQHSTKIIFGDLRNTEGELVYTDLSEMFPGYKFDAGKSTYRGEEVGEGGYVYAEPGMYEDVALLDVASMHPASIVNLNLLGRFTKKYSDLREARIAIKRNERETLKTILDGKLMPYLERADKGEFNLKDLSEGLKTVLNSAYGLTYAHHDNPFKDLRNKDNIVAKRGALFMIDLKYALQEKGAQVVHIKTDSVKIAKPTPELISFVFEFGKKYGYDFEHEATYSRFCLVNDAVYIAKYKDGKKAGTWTATGAQFAHPFVFKSLFSKEQIDFSDLCEDKSVTGKSALYLDLNEDLEEGEHNYHFVGRVGLFCPVEAGSGGGQLMREKEGKYYAATGTKGYRWLEAEVVKDAGISDQIDTSYHEKLVEEAIKDISKFGDFNWFVSD